MDRESSDISEASSDRTLELDMSPRSHQQHNGDGADAGVTSDEEKAIIQEIKEEIKRKVREDIKEELAKYDLNNLSSRTESVASSRDANDPAGDGLLPGVNNLLPERDAKYQEAYQKMLKLDKILRKRMAREREVKRDRAMLEKRIKEELEQLRNAGSSRRSKDEVNNTMKFLALTPASGPDARHDPDAGLNDEYSEPHTPVFPTEYLFEEGAAGAAAATDADADADSAGAAASSTARSGGPPGARRQRQKRQLPKDRKAAAASAPSKDGDASKDFIRRNIELAAASNDVVAMTPEERDRLDALLRDLDSIPELPEEFLDLSGGSNPYQLALTPGDGYRMSDEEARRLREIESGLARLGSVPPPLASARLLESASSRRCSELDTGLGAGYRTTALQRMQAGQDWDLDRLGEKALAEVKEERLMSHRLDELNSRLSLLGSESSQGPLSAEQMSTLLSDCARSIGHGSQQGTHRDLLQSAASTAAAGASASSMASVDGGDEASSERGVANSDRDGAPDESLMLQVPPLDRSVLDRLLAEARAARIGQNWVRPEPITEVEEEETAGMSDSSTGSDINDDDDEDAAERLVLPDISLYANMSAPKTPNSGRYSAS